MERNVLFPKESRKIREICPDSFEKQGKIDLKIYDL